MAVIKSGGYTQNDSSDKLRNKRMRIIEEERILKLERSLLLFYEKLMENYVLVKKNTSDSNESSEQKNQDLKESQTIENEEENNIVSKEEIEKITKEYAATKPLGF